MFEWNASGNEIDSSEPFIQIESESVALKASQALDW